MWTKQVILFYVFSICVHVYVYATNLTIEWTGLMYFISGLCSKSLFDGWVLTSYQSVLGLSSGFSNIHGLSVFVGSHSCSQVFSSFYIIYLNFLLIYKNQVA